MIEILPNWHPIFVHFTVALFSTSVALYLISYLFDKIKIYPTITIELNIVAKWCLWLTGFLIFFTVWAGWYAYNTVKHDAPSHLAMTDHRNWALVTACSIVLITLWSFWRTYKSKSVNLLFIIALIITQGLLLATGLRGAELVFNYGIGVKSLPNLEKSVHHHPNEIQQNLLLPTNKTNMEDEPHHHE